MIHIDRDKDRIKNMLNRIYRNSESDLVIDSLINSLDEGEIVVFNYTTENKAGTVITGAELREICKQLKTK